MTLLLLIALAASLALVPERGGVSRRRFWIPAHVAFERLDATSIAESAARNWTRRSRWRLPLDLVTCGAMLTALVAAARA